MLRLLAPLALVLAALLSGALVTARALAHDDADLRAFLSDGGCALPCWYGIRPGETRMEDAIAILRAHPWVARQMVDADISSPNREGALWWRWNGSQPAYIDGARDGRLAMRGNIVQYIVLPTTIPMGDIHVLFGRPERGMMARSGEYPGMVYLYAVFGGVQARNAAACPVWVADIWRAPVQLNLTPITDAAAFRTYDLPRWLRHPPCGA